MSDMIPVGLSPTIPGNQLVAFYGQLNRFIKHSGGTPIDVNTPQLTQEGAVTALMLLQARLVSGLLQLPDPAIQTEQTKLNAAYKNPVGYVSSQMNLITQTLAIYGDTIGLKTASAGLTSRTFPRKGLSAFGWVAVLGIVGLAGWGGYAFWRSRQS